MNLDTKWIELERPGISPKQEEGAWVFHSPWVSEREAEEESDLLGSRVFLYYLALLVALVFLVYVLV